MSRLLASFIALTALAAGAASGSAGAAPSERGAEASAEHRRIVDYWTAERRANAIPRDIVLDERGKPKPYAKPGTGTSSSSTGARWTGTGGVALTTGKVFFSVGSSNYVCSGSAVDTTHGSVVLTAGHCVHDGDGGPFVSNWAFYPGYSNGEHPTLKAWTATDLFTTVLWAGSANGFNDDAGFAVVYRENAGTLEQALTALGAPIPTFRADQTWGSSYHAFGYPAAKRYSGAYLYYCAGSVQHKYDGGDTLALPCSMTGGSSGGPWMRQYSTSTTPVVNSLNSYGYNGLTMMFGPVFGAGEQKAYDAAAVDGDCEPLSEAVPCKDYTDNP
jgi:V8-like Glu-specific endopeptidase